MATNKELADQATELGKELGIEVVTDRLNNAALTTLVGELTEKKAAKDAGMPARDPSLLPPGHARPTLEQFVAAGYKAENYEAHMAQWENDLLKQGSASSAPSTPPVLSTQQPQPRPPAAAKPAAPKADTDPPTRNLTLEAIELHVASQHMLAGKSREEAEKLARERVAQMALNK